MGFCRRDCAFISYLGDDKEELPVLCSGSRYFLVAAELVGYGDERSSSDSDGDTTYYRDLLFRYLDPATGETVLYEREYRSSRTIDAIVSMPVNYQGPIADIGKFSILQFPVPCSVYDPPEEVSKRFKPREYVNIDGKSAKGYPPVVVIPTKDEILAAAGK